MSRASVKAVFLDAGHTLLRAHPSVGEIYAEETARLGAEVSALQFEQHFRRIFDEFVPQYVARHAHHEASDEQDATMWREITRRIYDDVAELKKLEYEVWFRVLYEKFSEPEVWRFYPETRATLRRLREAGFRIGIISNWDTRFRRVATGMGIPDLVDKIFISAEVGARKPSPRIFEEALRHFGIAPHEALHIGDLFEEDVLGAYRAGIFPVWLNRSDRRAPPAEFPHWTVSHLGEFADRLISSGTGF